MKVNALRGLILASIFVAITAILAQVQVQLWIVPFSGQTLAVGLAATILGSRYGALSMVGYLLVGLIGVPVFAGLSGGPHVVFGPTGGYIIGFIASAFAIGWILEKSTFNLNMAIIANVVGMFVSLLFGVVQLKFILDLSWGAAMASGFYPFLIVGLIKAFLASWIGIMVRKRLIQANVMDVKSVA
ncbi:biotin transport system substrate-specific component [Gracilibacillus halotolerans]|uniref:Biotin transporter n=1 Tax=Gracilibacillus halotolerans TaxID=74386 RepID=A0A841RQK6_9BACI|nr:biotin transporter BioY [Gracilibacillus halotolerans]MBB6513204.1 biotin transport system substrate-specific component [Gracilibacillus halotolerans]